MEVAAEEGQSTIIKIKKEGQERRALMTEPATLKMAKIASTNGQLGDSAVHKHGGGVGERKRLHKGHRSCLTVSTIIPQQRTCTAAPLP